LGDLSINERIILKNILKEIRVWTGFTWIRTGKKGPSGDKLSGTTKGWK
jgi:hypothetical protein